MDFTVNWPSPEIFRRWTAVSTIAAALERRTWSHVIDKKLYPNMFILLVAPPGVGKSILEVEDELLRSTGLFNMGPPAMTKAAFVDQLGDKPKTFFYNELDGGEKKLVMYNAMTVIAPEFGTFLIENDVRFMNVLNDIFDCRSNFEDKIRGNKNTNRIDNPHLNLMGGTTPKYLGITLPESAYGLGFVSRLIMIYHGHRVIKPLFKTQTIDKKLKSNLRTDLGVIEKLNGEFLWTEEAHERMDDFWVRLEEGAPTDHRLIEYVKRRHIPVIKIAMIFAISEGNALNISITHIENAIKMVGDAESLMPDIFKEMSVSPDSNEMKVIHEWVHGRYLNQRERPVLERDINRQIYKKIPLHRAQYFLEAMINNGMLVETKAGVKGQREFVPGDISKYDD